MLISFSPRSVVSAYLSKEAVSELERLLQIFLALFKL